MHLCDYLEKIKILLKPFFILMSFNGWKNSYLSLKFFIITLPKKKIVKKSNA